MCGRLRIRRYRPDDEPDVRALGERAMVDALGSSPAAALDRDMDAVRGMARGTAGRFLVGVLDDRPVSTGGFDRLDATTAEVRVVRVDPAHQRAGFGGTLADALEAAAERRGVRRLVLDTHEDLTAARAFYEGRGYERVERASGGDGNLIRYEKRL